MKRILGILALLVALPVTAQELEIKPYGYFKVDLGFDSALSSHGNFAMYVKPYEIGGSASSTSLTARQTRLGLKINRDEMSGIVEFDFYGGGAENKNIPVLRKAYVDVPIGGLDLRAGQASDLVSPLVPNTINYTVLWGAGNIGYRRPLVKLSDRTKHLNWGVAIARNIGDDLNGDQILDGDAACTPAIQSRLGLPLAEGTELGVSGHYGRRTSDGAAEETYHSWSVNFDFRITVTPGFRILGEGYTGANVGSYYGAVLNGDCVTDLESRGGWVNVQADATDRTSFSIGYGIDDLANESTTRFANHPFTRSRNQVLFTNTSFEVVKGVTIGLEVSRWATHYLNVDADTVEEPVNYRAQWSLKSIF